MIMSSTASSAAVIATKAKGIPIDLFLVIVVCSVLFTIAIKFFVHSYVDYQLAKEKFNEAR